MAGGPGATPSRLLDALTWGVGVGVGVALGAYLTAVGGVGSPGVEGLDLSETFTLPVAAGGIVFVTVLGIEALVAVVRRARSSHRDQEQGGGKH